MRYVITTAITVALTLAGVFAFRLIQQSRSSQAPVAMATTQPKQLWTCGMHPQVIQDHPGNCPICHMKLTPLKMDDGGQPAANGQRKILYYWDPMLGPSSISNTSGTSAMGMKLVPAYEDEQSAGPAVRIDPTVVQNMGIRTADVSRGPLNKTVRAVGMLEVPEPNEYDINLKVSGWIKKLYANQEGMHVHHGEPLFDLYSPDVQVAEAELNSAEKSLRSLDANAASSLRQDAEHMVALAKQKLKQWDIAEQDIDALAKLDTPPDTVPIRNPVDGDLADKMVVDGSAVQAGTKLMRIEDHSTLWLNAEVYEENLSLLAVGQSIQATVDALPGKTFSGTISFVHPHVDHLTRTVTARVVIDNPKHELSPGMYAMVNLLANISADAISVPREAVIDTGARQIAFVATGDGHFDPRKVRMGILADDDRVQIIEGLSPGETVVTSGQFLLDVESRTTEAIHKLRQSTTQPTEPAGPDGRVP